MMYLSSCIVNEIRLLKVCSTHIITNHLNMQVQTLCFAVPDTTDVYNIPKYLDNHCFTISPHLDKRYVFLNQYKINKAIRL